MTCLSENGEGCDLSSQGSDRFLLLRDLGCVVFSDIYRCSALDASVFRLQECSCEPGAIVGISGEQ